MNVRAVIADLDGVLVDTVEAHERSWLRVASELGIELTVDELAGFRGVARQLGVDRLIARSGRRDASLPRLMELKAAAFRDEVRRRGPSIAVPRAGWLLYELRKHRIRLAVASASRHAEMLLKLTHLRAAVEVVSDGWFSGPPKPAPDQLRSIARAIDLDPGDCLVLEDSLDGLRAADAAGMRPFGIGPVARSYPRLVGHATSVTELTVPAIVGRPRPHIVMTHRLAPQRTR